MNNEQSTKNQLMLESYYHKLKEIVDFSNPEPQVLGEIGSGSTELTFTVGMHGDEIFPICAVQELLPTLTHTPLLRSGKVRFITCNVPAIAARKRFIDEDFNDVFPGNAVGNAERSLATRLLPMVQESPFVVDLHTGIYAPPFAVLPTKDYDKLVLAEQSGIDKIVLFENPAGHDTGPMVDCTPCGIGIENGPHADDSSLDVSKRVILTYLQSFGFLPKETTDDDKEPSYYHIVHHLSLADGKRIHAQHMDVPFLEFSPMPSELFPVETGDSSLYPLLIDPERTYEDVYAYMARKVSRDQLVDFIKS